MPRLHESLNEKQSAECSINLYAECDQVNVHVPLSTTAKIRLDLFHTQQHNAAPLRSALCALRSALWVTRGVYTAVAPRSTWKQHGVHYDALGAYHCAIGQQSD